MSEIEEIIIRALPRIALRLQNELVLACPVDKGILRNSIKVIPSPSGIGLLISMVIYGKYVEFGTPPHTIKPSEKEALKFKGDEGDVIVKKIEHPGTRPNPFIRNTINNKLKKIIAEEILK